jgi:2-C-methyl-D-erythritol 4-phosphate cytidylyltransferase
MNTADAIIVAAGTGSRFGAPKQLMPLLGRPLYRHSVETFATHPMVARVILVVSEDVVGAITADLAATSFKERIELVLGGSTRQNSVSNGLAMLAEGASTGVVLVHDAARPGVDAVIISSVIDAASESGSALVAIPVVDTLKRESGGHSVATVSRAQLWRAQTPQGAKTPLLLRAIDEAKALGYEGTDEAELLERSGQHPRLLLGSEQNMKVTFSDDLDRISRLIKPASY